MVKLGRTFLLPYKDLDPDQPLEAVHLWASVDCQVRAEASPVEIVDGKALIVTVGSCVGGLPGGGIGASVGVTETLSLIPSHVKVKVFGEVMRAGDWAPFSDLTPDQSPEARQELAFSVVQERNTEVL